MYGNYYYCIIIFHVKREFKYCFRVLHARGTVLSSCCYYRRADFVTSLINRKEALCRSLIRRLEGSQTDFSVFFFPRRRGVACGVGNRVNNTRTEDERKKKRKFEIYIRYTLSFAARIFLRTRYIISVIFNGRHFHVKSLSTPPPADFPWPDGGGIRFH